MNNRKYRHFFYVPQSLYIYFIEMKGLSSDDQCSYYIVSIDILNINKALQKPAR